MQGCINPPRKATATEIQLSSVLSMKRKVGNITSDESMRRSVKVEKIGMNSLRSKVSPDPVLLIAIAPSTKQSSLLLLSPRYSTYQQTIAHGEAFHETFIFGSFARSARTVHRKCAREPRIKPNSHGSRGVAYRKRS